MLVLLTSRGSFILGILKRLEEGIEGSLDYLIGRPVYQSTPNPTLLDSVLVREKVPLGFEPMLSNV